MLPKLAQSWAFNLPARPATTPGSGCPLARAYLRLVARRVLKLGSAAHGLPAVVDHLPAGLAEAPGHARGCGSAKAPRWARGRGGARSARRVRASGPRAGVARASGWARAGCVSARVHACLCGRERESRPPARRSPCALLCLRPPQSPRLLFFFLSRTLFAFYCSPGLPVTPTPTLTPCALRWLPSTSERLRYRRQNRPRPPGPAGGQPTRGQPGPRPLPGGPGNPRPRLLANFLPGRTRANSPGAGVRLRAGLAGAPAGPSGVSRERSLVPPGSQRGAGSPPTRPGLGGRGINWPERALCVSPRSRAGPGARAPPGTAPCGARPARLALEAPGPESAGLCPGAGGRRAGPTPPSPPPPRQQPAPRSRGRAGPCAARAPRRSPALPRRAPRPPRSRLLLCPAEQGFVPGGGFLVATAHQQHF